MNEWWRSYYREISFFFTAAHIQHYDIMILM